MVTIMASLRFSKCQYLLCLQIIIKVHCVLIDALKPEMGFRLRRGLEIMLGLLLLLMGGSICETADDCSRAHQNKLNSFFAILIYLGDPNIRSLIPIII